MQVKHTPGPWWRDDDGFIVSGTRDSYVTVADGDCSSDIDIAEREANKDLIAAAPETAEALEKARAFILTLSKLYAERRTDVSAICERFLDTGETKPGWVESRYVDVNVPPGTARVEYDTMTTEMIAFDVYGDPLASTRMVHEYYNDNDKADTEDAGGVTPVPYTVVDENQLGEPLGTTVVCPGCGDRHPVEYSKSKDADGNFTVENKLLAFYMCGKKAYLCGVDGRRIK